MLRTSMRAMSFCRASSIDSLLTVRMPTGSVPVASNGIATGGRVFGGRLGSAPSASELTSVSASLGSMSSRKWTLTMLTPGTERLSTSRAPGAWLTHRSMRLVIVFSIDWAGMPG